MRWRRAILAVLTAWAGGCECEARTIRASFLDSAPSGRLRRPLQATFPSFRSSVRTAARAESEPGAAEQGLSGAVHSHTVSKKGGKKKKKEHATEAFFFRAECDWMTGTASCPLRRDTGSNVALLCYPPVAQKKTAEDLVCVSDVWCHEFLSLLRNAHTVAGDEC